MKFSLKAFPYSLRLTIPLLLFGLGCGVNLISYQQVSESNHDRVEREAIQQANITASQTVTLLEYLHRDSQLKNTSEGIRLLLAQIRSAKNIETVLITDDHDQILLANQPTLQGKSIAQTKFAPHLNLFTQVRNQLIGQTIIVENQENHSEQVKSFYPVRLALQPGELQASRIGLLVLDYSLQKPLAQAAEDARQKSLIISGILLIVGLGVWVLLDRLITRRVNLLVAISQRWAQGELSDRVTLLGSDEFAKIGIALNSMASSLEVGTAAIKTSEAELRDRGIELQTMLDRLQSTQSQLVQTEKMSSLGQMVAGIAHEVNNPIGFIHGNITHVSRYAEDLLNLISLYQTHYPQPIAEIETAIEKMDLDFLRQDFPQMMASMQMGTERVKNIVLSLRNFSRLDESGSKGIDLHEGIESTLLILQHRFKASRVRITVRKNYANLPLVYCHAGQINQVFMNVLANALDAIDEHLETQPDYVPELTIRTECLDSRVRVEIIDNGPGMPESVQRRLFDPFFTTKAVGKGTGLGLSISYQIVVETHQGNLECRSQLGQGTTFSIELPIQVGGAIDSLPEKDSLLKVPLAFAAQSTPTLALTP
jgi:signal transduction histidine kinase